MRRPLRLALLLLLLTACAAPTIATPSPTAGPTPRPAGTATPTPLSEVVTPPLLVTRQPPPSALATPTLASAVASPPLIVGRPPASAPAKAAAPAGRAWVVLGPEGPIARLQTTAADCPTITLDGIEQPLQPRARPQPPAFPILVCERPIPAGVRSASIAGQRLPLPSGTPRRVAVLGDTGCRLAANRLQACNDPQAWPLAHIAAAIAAWQPDLIIHVGDYLYRERACPADSVGCTGSPWGDTWSAWEADLFEPIAPLLPVAPWIFTRGNHELCERGGEGWFRLLEPRPRPTSCSDLTEPYVLRIGDLRLLMLDSAPASDTTTPTDLVAVYRRQLETLRPAATDGAWLVTHKPLWGLLSFPVVGARRVGNLTLQAAVGDALPPGVALVLSGHIHLAQVLNHGGGPTVQLIAGHGGTLLDDPVSPRQPDDAAGVIHAHGFLTLEPAGAGWSVTTRNASGRPLGRCSLPAGQPVCQSP